MNKIKLIKIKSNSQLNIWYLNDRFCIIRFVEFLNYYQLNIYIYIYLRKLPVTTPLFTPGHQEPFGHTIELLIFNLYIYI